MTRPKSVAKAIVVPLHLTVAEVEAVIQALSWAESLEGEQEGAKAEGMSAVITGLPFERARLKVLRQFKRRP